MVNLLFLAHNRLEFTRAAAEALIANTDWAMVERVLLYDDASEDGTREYLSGVRFPVETHFRSGAFGSPVAVMNHAILSLPHEGLLAKVDNDTVVPPDWLRQAYQALSTDDRLDLLGIEAHFEITQNGRRSYRPAEFIGGIGLMRLRAFVTLPRPTQRYGFTAWQQKSHEWVRAGWIEPSMPVFLLDRLPREPWASYSAEYVRRGWQREWSKYSEAQRALWDWWTA